MSKGFGASVPIDWLACKLSEKKNLFHFTLVWISFFATGSSNLCFAQSQMDFSGLLGYEKIHISSLDSSDPQTRNTALLDYLKLAATQLNASGYKTTLIEKPNPRLRLDFIPGRFAKALLLVASFWKEKPEIYFVHLDEYSIGGHFPASRDIVFTARGLERFDSGDLSVFFHELRHWRNQANILAERPGSLTGAVVTDQKFEDAVLYENRISIEELTNFTRQIGSTLDSMRSGHSSLRQADFLFVNAVSFQKIFEQRLSKIENILENMEPLSFSRSPQAFHSAYGDQSIFFIYNVDTMYTHNGLGLNIIIQSQSSIEKWGVELFIPTSSSTINLNDIVRVALEQVRQLRRYATSFTPLLLQYDTILAPLRTQNPSPLSDHAKKLSAALKATQLNQCQEIFGPLNL